MNALRASFDAAVSLFRNWNEQQPAQVAVPIEAAPIRPHYHEDDHNSGCWDLYDYYGPCTCRSSGPATDRNCRVCQRTARVKGWAT